MEGGELLRSLGRRPELASMRQKDLDNFRVELAAGPFAQPAASLLDRQPLSVGPVGRHRVECVADQDDPRLQRNGLTGDSVWIAPPVVVLVAASDDRAHLGESL